MKATISKPTAKSNSLLSRYKDAKPEGGLPIFRFEKPSDAIVAEFIARRQVITKLGDGRVLDVEIVERSDGGTIGQHSIIESTHFTKIFDSKDLKRGDRFYLRLHEIDAMSKFNRFAFELVDGAGANPSADDDIPF
jgi:hypothetical protein